LIVEDTGDDERSYHSSEDLWNDVVGCFPPWETYIREWQMSFRKTLGTKKIEELTLKETESNGESGTEVTSRCRGSDNDSDWKGQLSKFELSVVYERKTKTHKKYRERRRNRSSGGTRSPSTWPQLWLGEWLKRRHHRRRKCRLPGTRRNIRRGEAVFAFPYSAQTISPCVEEQYKILDVPSSEPFRCCRKRSSVMSSGCHLILSQEIRNSDLNISCVAI